MSLSSPSSPTAWSRFKRLLPWLLTSICISYILWTSDFAIAYKTLSQVPLLPFTLTVFFIGGASYLLNAFTIKCLFQRFHLPTTLKEALLYKGASYVLKVINYNISVAGIALFFRNHKQVPLLETLSSMLWLNVADVGALAFIVLVSLLFPWAPLPALLIKSILVLAAGLWVLLLGNLLYWRAGWDFFFLGKLRTWQIFRTFREAKLTDYGFFLLLRLAFLFLLTLAHASLLPMFGISIPFAVLLFYIPLSIFVSTIPMTNLAGLGSVQILLRELFAPYASLGSAQIDAYTTTYLLSFLVIRLAIGMVCVRSVSFRF